MKSLILTMKSLILASCTFGLSMPSALSAGLPANSNIDAVELHPDSALITRLAHCNLPAGDTTITVQGLSPYLIEQSLQVSGAEGDGITIRSVSVHREAPRTGQITPEEQALIDEQQDLRGRLDSLQTKQRMIRNFAAAPPTMTVAATGSAPAPEFWPAIWNKVSDTLEDTNRRLRETQKRLDIVTATLANAHPATEQAIQSAQTVSIDITAGHATEASIKLVYQVGGANWRPAYDARLRTDHQPAQIDLARRARIEQTSGEDWTNVSLTLSTTRLSAATKAPTLDETHDLTRNSVQSEPMATPDAAAAAVKSFARPIAKLEVIATPYDATLLLPGRVSVASGAASKLYTTGSSTADVELYVKSAPIIDKRAYLQAKFVSADRIPLVPGEADLYRDGTFIGRTALDGAAQGDQVSLGFGADDLVSVERTDTGRKERNTTIDSGVASVERSFKTAVTNRHSFPVRIEIDDREPAFNNTAIVLKEAQGMTPPAGRNIEGHRGVLAWIDTYAPRETRTINFAWRVHWPAKLGPIMDNEDTQYFRFSGGATF